MISLTIAALIALAPAAPDEPTLPNPVADSSETSGAVAVPADTSVRVPGCPLRFGETTERVQRFGEFPIVSVPGHPREVARRREGVWFGVGGTYTLFFQTGVLRRVEFTAKDVSPNGIDYVQDQLRASGFRRSCESAETCTWHGRATVHLTIRGATLSSSLEPAPQPARPAAPVRPALVVVPEPFVFGRADSAGRLPEPRALDHPAPAYPIAARAARVQGNVWVRALVDTGGGVMAVTVIRTIPELETAAVENARQWRFEPYRVDGVPARFEIEFPVRFVLR